MTVLPQARGLFPDSALVVHHGVKHLLLLEPAHAIAAASVVTLLREIYHEVALATAETEAARSRRGRYTSRTPTCPDGRLGAALRAVAAWAGCEPAPNLGRAAAVAPSTVASSPSGLGSSPKNLRRRSANGDVSHLRTDMRRMLLGLGESAGGGRQLEKVDAANAALLLELAVERASERRSRLNAATLAFVVLTHGVGFSIFVRRATAHTTGEAEVAEGGLLGVTLKQGLAISLAHAGTVAVFASVGLRPSTRTKAQLVAFMCGICAVVCVVLSLVYVVQFEATRDGVLANIAALEAAGGPLAPRARAAGRLACEAWASVLATSFLVCMPLVVGALGWACGRRERAAQHELHGQALLRGLWRVSAIWCAWLCLLPCWRACEETTRPPSAAVHALDAFCALLHGFCFVLSVSPAARLSLERTAARALGAHGALASLAPLIGFGGPESAPAPTPTDLVAQASAEFRTLTLGADARALLVSATWARSVTARTPEAGADPTARAHRVAQPASIDAGSVVASSSSSAARASLFDPAAPERRSERGALWAAHTERADAFVWSTPADEQRSLRALCAWAERFEAKKGRPPTVWVRALCADLSRTAAELLAQLPCYQARCDTLLLLASPRTPLSLNAAVVCHVWRTLGGPPDSVDVELVSAAEREATVAAFDTFHVMHACADKRLPSEDGEGEREAVAERLQLCVQLATSLALNPAIRELLPAVHRAAAAAAADAGTERVGGRAASAAGGGRGSAKQHAQQRGRGCLGAGGRRVCTTDGRKAGVALL
jgi:hypothetical protein